MVIAIVWSQMDDQRVSKTTWAWVCVAVTVVLVAVIVVTAHFTGQGATSPRTR